MISTGDLRPEPAWGRSTEHTRVQPLTAEARSTQAIDRLLIAERIYRYGWAFDERDRAGLGDCFTDDGVWEGLIMGLDRVGPFEGRGAIEEWLAQFWVEQSDQRRHVFTNVVIDELDGSRATAHAYLILLASANATMTPLTAGPYRLSMVKEQEVWRIARLTAGFDAPF